MILKIKQNFFFFLQIPSPPSSTDTDSDSGIGLSSNSNSPSSNEQLNDFVLDLNPKSTTTDNQIDVRYVSFLFCQLN